VGQRTIQGAPDIFLGWGEVDGHQFYVRQLRDMKGGAEFDPKTILVEAFPEYTALCGWALALAHAKSGDPAMLAGYLGKGRWPRVFALAMTCWERFRAAGEIPSSTSRSSMRAYQTSR
jgi:Uncharacterized protein conserved in bacteria (DUF2252)